VARRAIGSDYGDRSCQSGRANRLAKLAIGGNVIVHNNSLNGPDINSG
jgi:hypothetical protein